MVIFLHKIKVFLMGIPGDFSDSLMKSSTGYLYREGVPPGEERTPEGRAWLHNSHLKGNIPH